MSCPTMLSESINIGMSIFIGKTQGFYFQFLGYWE